MASAPTAGATADAGAAGPDAAADFEQDTGTLKWTTHACSGAVPAARSGHSLSIVNGVAFLFGGCGEASNGVDENGMELFGPTADMYYCRLEAAGSSAKMRWERATCGGETPLARWGHTATVVDKKQFVVFGGFHSDTNRFNDLHIFDTGKLMWIQPLETMADFTPRGNHIPRRGIPNAVPSPRGGHSTTLVGRSLVVFGGYGGVGYARRDFNDTAVFDLDALEWRKMPNTQGKAPEARSGHSAAIHRDMAIFYFGGWNACVFFSFFVLVHFIPLTLVLSSVFLTLPTPPHSPHTNASHTTQPSPI